VDKNERLLLTLDSQRLRVSMGRVAIFNDVAVAGYRLPMPDINVRRVTAALFCAHEYLVLE
jgi:hypothetical protein